MKVAIIGYGGRGKTYGYILQEKGIEICAVCDIDPNKLRLAQKDLGISDAGLYDSEEKLFAQDKLADILIVSTQDELHKRHALKGLERGYDLLLEKPISTSVDNCLEIAERAKALGRKIFVCHVLRYAPFFNVIKEQLETGKYGKLSTVNLMENVGYWHQAHSYVRGNWRNDETSTPMIIAKCCHDLDLLSWFAGEKCVAVSSFGGLNLFTEENAPVGAAERCVDCKYKGKCEYDAVGFYIEERLKNGDAGWPCNIVVPEPTIEKMYEALKTGPYGKCIYKCDNNVVDHQVVNMLFEGGATAHLTMTAFSKDCYRSIHVHCERGEIYGDMRDYKLHCKLFGKEEWEIDTSAIANEYGHGGGDERMLADVIDYYEGKNCKSLTSIDASLQSHVIGFHAEESRKQGGALIKL